MSATMHGADVAQLRHLAAQFDAKAQALDADRMAVGNAIQIRAWFGPVAVRFRHAWDSDYSRRLHDAAVRLRDAATKLRANADDQERTSAVDSRAGRHSVGAFVEHTGDHGDLYPAPRSTADVYSAIHEMQGKDKGGDGVRVQVIRGDDGKERIVVYVNGTKSDANDRFTWGANVDLMAGKNPESLQHVRRLLKEAAAAHPDAEIMLAGYSQGGIIAQRLALEGDPKISAVVTYGAPRMPIGLGAVDIVRLEHNGDIVPGLGNSSALNDSAYADEARRAGGSDVVYRGGNPAQIFGGNPHTDQGDYRWLADEFDTSDRSVDKDGRAVLDRFGGTVVSDQK